MNQTTGGAGASGGPLNSLPVNQRIRRLPHDGRRARNKRSIIRRRSRQVDFQNLAVAVIRSREAPALSVYT